MKQKYFIYIGNAYPHKNLVSLIKAVVQLNKLSSEKIILKIRSGRGVFKERVLKMISDNNARDCVEYLDFVSDSKLQMLYKNSIAFVFPTLDEGFGLPPMEAIEAGTLVAQSNIPVLKEVYGDSCFYFNPKDIDSISDTLIKITKLTKKEREKKIKYSREFIKKYSWQKMAKETLKVYEEASKK